MHNLCTTTGSSKFYLGFRFYTGFKKSLCQIIYAIHVSHYQRWAIFCNFSASKTYFVLAQQDHFSNYFWIAVRGLNILDAVETKIRQCMSAMDPILQRHV